MNFLPKVKSRFTVCSLTNHEVPDVCVPVGRAGDDPVGVGRPVDARHADVMLVEFCHRGVPEMGKHTFERSFAIITLKERSCYRGNMLLLNSN